MIEKVKSVILGTASKLTWLPSLLARLVIGAVFIQAGWGKLHHLDKTAQFFKSLGIPAPELQAPFVASVEWAGGILILLGLFTRIAALPLIGTMVVAIWTAKLSGLGGPIDFFGLQELDYIVLLLLLFVYGGGRFSADQLICKRCAGTAK